MCEKKKQQNVHAKINKKCVKKSPGNLQETHEKSPKNA